MSQPASLPSYLRLEHVLLSISLSPSLSPFQDPPVSILLTKNGLHASVKSIGCSEYSLPPKRMLITRHPQREAHCGEEEAQAIRQETKRPTAAHPTSIFCQTPPPEPYPFESWCLVQLQGVVGPQVETDPVDDALPHVTPQGHLSLVLRRYFWLVGSNRTITPSRR